MKFTLLCLLQLATAGGDHDPKNAATTELRIKPSAVVRGLEVTVGDLCDITPVNAETLALGQIKFGRAPSQGHSRIIVRSELIQALAAAGRDVAEFKIEGSREIVVQAVVTEIPAQEILDTATAVLQAILQHEGGDVEYEAPGRIRQIQAPPGRRSQELKGRLRGDHTSPNAAIIDIDILVDGEVFKQVPVQFRLTRYQPVLKTLGAIRAGTALGPENVAIVREAVAQTNSFYLSRLEQVAGMIANRNLQSDQRLALGDIAPPAVIHKGDSVTVVLTQGRVKVTAKALANHDAPLGGRITLTNSQSRSQMAGIVTAPGLVVIQQ
jgi:flagella basal body P-ring formation protein FlgA